jgi:hypothetical protein
VDKRVTGLQTGKDLSIFLDFTENSPGQLATLSDVRDIETMSLIGLPGLPVDAEFWEMLGSVKSMVDLSFNEVPLDRIQQLLKKKNAPRIVCNATSLSNAEHASLCELATEHGNEYFGSHLSSQDINAVVNATLRFSGGNTVFPVTVMANFPYSTQTVNGLPWEPTTSDTQVKLYLDGETAGTPPIEFWQDLEGLSNEPKLHVMLSHLSLAECAGIENVAVHHLSVDNPSISDIDTIAELQSLESVQLRWNAHHAPIDLQPLSKLMRLTDIYVEGNALTDSFMAATKAPLEYVAFDGCQCGQDTFRRLELFPNLHTLMLFYVSSDLESFRHLRVPESISKVSIATTDECGPIAASTLRDQLDVETVEVEINFVRLEPR